MNISHKRRGVEGAYVLCTYSMYVYYVHITKIMIIAVVTMRTTLII